MPDRDHANPLVPPHKSAPSPAPHSGTGATVSPWGGCWECVRKRHPDETARLTAPDTWSRDAAAHPAAGHLVLVPDDAADPITDYRVTPDWTPQSHALWVTWRPQTARLPRGSVLLVATGEPLPNTVSQWHQLARRASAQDLDCEVLLRAVLRLAASARWVVTLGDGRYHHSDEYVRHTADHTVRISSADSAVRPLGARRRHLRETETWSDGKLVWESEVQVLFGGRDVASSDDQPRAVRLDSALVRVAHTDAPGRGVEDRLTETFGGTWTWNGPEDHEYLTVAYDD